MKLRRAQRRRRPSPDRDCYRTRMRRRERPRLPRGRRRAAGAPGFARHLRHQRSGGARRLHRARKSRQGARRDRDWIRRPAGGPRRDPRGPNLRPPDPVSGQDGGANRRRDHAAFEGRNPARRDADSHPPAAARRCDPRHAARAGDDADHPARQQDVREVPGVRDGDEPQAVQRGLRRPLCGSFPPSTPTSTRSSAASTRRRQASSRLYFNGI